MMKAGQLLIHTGKHKCFGQFSQRNIARMWSHGVFWKMKKSGFLHNDYHARLPMTDFNKHTLRVL